MNRITASCRSSSSRALFLSHLHPVPNLLVLAAWFFLGALLSGPALADETESASPQTAAYTVELDGAGDLTGFLNENLDLIRKVKEIELHPEEFRRLAGAANRQIQELLATEGYFSSKVTHVLEQADERWFARFVIDTGPPVLIDKVDLRFAGHIASDPEAQQRINRLRRQWSLDPEDRFRQEEWDAAKNTLLKGLLNRDYPAARITESEARIDPEQRSASLMVTVDSGPPFTFGTLEIQGLERYSREMVDNLNPIKPGDAFSQEKLNELQARLQDTGYFRSAFATIEVDTANPQQVPVRLDLVEQKLHRLGLGVGFSTDNGARAEIKWLDRQFLGRDWRLQSNLLVDRNTRLIGGDVSMQPLENGWHPNFSGSFERSELTGQVTDTIRTTARLTSPSKQNEQSVALSFLADRQRIPGLSPNNRQALIASYRYTMRRVDNLITPRRGHVTSIELGAGPVENLSGQHIARVLAQTTFLHTFDRRWQAVLRAQAGQVSGASRQSVPEDLLFRTGGDQTVRGYGYNTLGVEEGGATVGGRVFGLLSAELVHYFTPEWGAAVFTDAGSATDSWSDFRVKQGSGIGARWRSPIGPINVDLAYGHATREPRIHFSVGYGF
ncbi:MAG: autotransporter assembly complex protein TamA [Burkholderiaceae bacterium]